MLLVRNNFVWLEDLTNSHLPAVSSLPHFSLSTQSAGQRTEKTLPRNGTELNHPFDNILEITRSPLSNSSFSFSSCLQRTDHSCLVWR